MAYIHMYSGNVNYTRSKGLPCFLEFYLPTLIIWLELNKIANKPYP